MGVDDTPTVDSSTSEVKEETVTGTTIASLDKGIEKTESLENGEISKTDQSTVPVEKTNTPEVIYCTIYNIFYIQQQDNTLAEQGKQKTLGRNDRRKHKTIQTHVWNASRNLDKDKKGRKVRSRTQETSTRGEITG